MNHLKMIALATALGLSTAAATAQGPGVTTIASYPHGNFLENLSIDKSGRLLFTSYIAKTIFLWRGSGAPTPLVTLDVHPVAVLARAKDVIVTAHGKSFAEGPAFTKTNQFLILDRTGKLKKRIPAPDALFLNGMVELSPTVILAADSLGQKIWAFNPTTCQITEWLSDPLLGPDPVNPSQKPGANGLKLKDGMLYISNSARGAIYRVAIAKAKSTGTMELFAKSGPIDDFAFLSDGSIAAATHGKNLVRIVGDHITDIIPDGCDSCTSVVPYGRGNSLIVLTTGNLVEGGTAPARMLHVRSPVR